MPDQTTATDQSQNQPDNVYPYPLPPAAGTQISLASDFKSAAMWFLLGAAAGMLVIMWMNGKTQTKHSL